MDYYCERTLKQVSSFLLAILIRYLEGVGGGSGSCNMDSYPNGPLPVPEDMLRCCNVDSYPMDLFLYLPLKIC